MRPELSICRNVGRALRSAADTESALELVAEAAQSATRSAQATVRLLDPRERRLLVAARTGAAMHVGGPGCFRAGEGLVGWSAKHGAAARVNDVTCDSRFQSRRDHLWTPSGILAAPLLAGSNEVIGVLSAARRDGPAYGDEHLSALELLAELAALHVQAARLRELAETDPLTGLFNRRHLMDRFASELATAVRHGRPLSLIMLDLDHFKSVNEDYGHNVGDEVLVETARRLRRAGRASDVLFRWGGEEFLLLLPDTAAEEALGVAERVLGILRATGFSTTAGVIPVTASAGVCGVRPTDSLLAAQERADGRLSEAKRRGRNRAIGSSGRAEGGQAAARRSEARPEHARTPLGAEPLEAVRQNRRS